MELPAELLVKIGGYTDGKTVHSMLRTNKRINAICDRNQRDLPKCVVELAIEHDDHRENLKLTVFMRSRERKEKRRFVATLVDDDCYHTEEQKRERVAEFYEENAASNLINIPIFINSHLQRHMWRERRRHFPIGLMAGLHMHLDYILLKVDFSLLRLENLTIEEIAVVYQHLQMKESKVGRVILSSSYYLPLSAMPPANIVKGLTTENPPEGFYQLPSIHELSTLAVLSCYNGVLLHDDDFCKIKASLIVMDGRGCQITERGIRNFITQWSESKREIYNVQLDSREDARDDEDENWRRVALSLDPRLVRVGGYADKSISSLMSLTRLADNVKLQFCWDPAYHSYVEFLRISSSDEPDFE